MRCPAARLPGRGGFPAALVVDALVRAVPAGDVAQVAADALRRIDARDDLVVQVEVLPFLHPGQRAAAEILYGPVSLLVHPVGKTVDHVLHDPVAVMHHRRADLDRAAAQQDELRRLAPAGNAADAGDRKADLGVGGDLLHEVQRDGLHRGAAVAAVRGEPADVGPRGERVQVDAGDGVDGVDGGEGVRAAALAPRGPRRGCR